MGAEQIYGLKHCLNVSLVKVSYFSTTFNTFNCFQVVATCFNNCRASHTGDVIRVMYSSVSVGDVHVLCTCAQVQSTV